jgi:hypothetical protein
MTPDAQRSAQNSRANLAREDRVHTTQQEEGQVQ